MAEVSEKRHDEYELVWKNGHTERVRACQVTWAGQSFGLSGPSEAVRVVFHAEVEGQWTLILSVREDEIVIVRNVTRTEDAA